MEWKLFATVFAAVFIAELGDKTQLATLLFASDRDVSKWLVFSAASCALVLSSALGVLLGGALSGVFNERLLNHMAGLGFVIIGLVTLFRA